MMTTDSDRAHALKMVQQLRAGAVGQGGARYSNLSSLAAHGLGGSAAMPSSGPDLFKTLVHKQVDREWLNRKKYGGPSANDLHSLYAPDPLVELRVSGSGGTSGAVPVDAAALQFAREDESSSSSQHALSRFIAPVPAEQLLRHCNAVDFSPLNSETAAASSQRAVYEKRRVANLLHLTSSPLVL
jgi:hypothetical protein